MDALELAWWVALRRGEQALIELLDGDPAFGAALASGTLPPPAGEALQADWQEFCHRPNRKDLRKLHPASFEYWVAHLRAQVSVMTAPQRELWAGFLKGEEARTCILFKYGDDFDKKDYRAGSEDQQISPKTFRSLTFRAARKRKKKMPWVEVDELMAAAKVGLVHAVDRFDHTGGHKSPAYAEPVIDTDIRNAIEVTRGHSRDLNLAIKQVREAMRDLALDPSSDDISTDAIDATAQLTKLDRKRVQDALNALRLDEPAGEWKPGPDEQEISTFDEAAFMQFGGDSAPRKVKEALADAISKGGLTEPERRAVMLYYWDGLSDEEIAARLGTTPNNAKQLRHRGIKKVEKWLVARGLNSTRAASAEQPLLGWPCLSYLAGEEYDTARMLTVALESLSCLSAVERAVVEGYWQRQTAGQVASVLAVTEPQVGRLRRVALRKLSDWFQQRQGSFPAAWPTLKAEGWVALLEASFRFKPLPKIPENCDVVEKIEAWNLARPGRILLEVIGALGSIPPEDRRLLELYWAGRFSDVAEAANTQCQQNKLQQLALARDKFVSWLAARLKAKGTSTRKARPRNQP